MAFSQLLFIFYSICFAFAVCWAGRVGVFQYRPGDIWRLWSDTPDSMGKKSKNRAKARPISGEKLPRCKMCSSFVRANGVKCPGCAAIFCSRCEVKVGGCCPAGDNCIRPTWRCFDCIRGETVQKKLTDMARDGKLTNEEIGEINEGKNSAVSNEHYKITIPMRHFDRICGDNPELLPLIICTADGCHTSLCRFCRDRDEEKARKFGKFPRILQCKKCSTTRCLTCISSQGDATIVRCMNCTDQYCLDCADPDWIPRRVGNETICQPCMYWSAKPCTNPDCPNEIGTVPTKRCGDCRCARYCSKKCQVAMRSTHKDECAKMMKKREKKIARRLAKNDMQEEAT